MEERLAEDKMYCPEPTCSVFMNLDNLSGEMKRAQPSSLCYACGTPICLVCKKTWHEGITCAQSKAEAESAFIREMAQAEGWKLCPGCKNMVEKNEGCNHITCRCGKQFCYKCGQVWGTCSCKLFDDGDEQSIDDENQDLYEEDWYDEPEPDEHPRYVIGRYPNNHYRHRQDQIRRRECLEHTFRHWSPRAGIWRRCRNCGFFMSHYCFACTFCHREVCQRCSGFPRY